MYYEFTDLDKMSVVQGETSYLVKEPDGKTIAKVSDQKTGLFFLGAFNMANVLLRIISRHNSAYKDGQCGCTDCASAKDALQKAGVAYK